MAPPTIGARTGRSRTVAAAVLAAFGICASLIIAPSPTSAASGDITEYPVTAGSGVWSVAAGPDGRMWFTENSGNRIGAIDPVTGVVDEYPLPIASLFPYGIAAGPDGNMWFSLTWSGRVGRITPSGDITLFPASTAAGNRRGIAAGPDGKMWIASTSLIESVTMSGDITEYGPPSDFPEDIALGPDGRMWVAAWRSIDAIAPDGTLTHYPTSRSVNGMAAGSDDRMWFTDTVGDIVGAISVAGAITEFPLAPLTRPRKIVAGPRDTLWFSGDLSDTINSITTDGVVTRYALPPGSDPEGLAFSPDGRMLWFRTAGGDSISSLELPQPPTFTSTTLPDGTVASGYTTTLTADGDTPMSFAVTTGTLPDGLVLDPASGVISGTPTRVETASFTVTATNAVGTGDVALSITIAAAPAVPPAPPVLPGPPTSPAPPGPPAPPDPPAPSAPSDPLASPTTPGTAGGPASAADKSDTDRLADTGADQAPPATFGLLLIAFGVLIVSLRARTRRR